MNRILTAVASLAFATSAFAAEPAETAERPTVGNLSQAEGTVMVNQGEQFVTAELGQGLSEGDRVMAMEGASATILFNDGCELEVEEGAMVVVPKDSTCSGAVAAVQKVGPNYAQAVGTVTEEESRRRGAFWVFGISALVIAHEIAEGDDNITSP